MADAGDPSDRDSTGNQDGHVEPSPRTGSNPVSHARPDGAVAGSAGLRSAGESDVFARNIHDGAPNQQGSGCGGRRDVQNVQHFS